MQGTMSSDVWNRDSSPTRQFTNMHFEDRTLTELKSFYFVFIWNVPSLTINV